MNELPSLESLRKLYEAAIHIRKLAPWEWMVETNLFGVEHPESGEVGFVSTMGALGQHFAVAVYLGAEGLDGFRELHEGRNTDVPERLFEIPQIQASFEARSQLQKRDLETIKTLGFKFRGDFSWPLFRSYRPGYYPWFLEEYEAQVLTYALEQLAEVAPRLEEDPSLLESSDNRKVFVRTRDGEGTSALWQDRWRTFPPPPPRSIEAFIDPNLLQGLRSQPRLANTFEIDLFQVPASIGGRNARPAWTFILLIVDEESGHVVLVDVLTAAPSLTEMWASVPERVVTMLAKAEAVPGKIKISSDRLQELLKPWAALVPFKLVKAKRLPGIEHARAALIASMGG